MGMIIDQWFVCLILFQVIFCSWIIFSAQKKMSCSWIMDGAMHPPGCRGCERLDGNNMKQKLEKRGRLMNVKATTFELIHFQQRMIPTFLLEIIPWTDFKAGGENRICSAGVQIRVWHSFHINFGTNEYPNIFVSRIWYEWIYTFILKSIFDIKKYPNIFISTILYEQISEFICIHKIDMNEYQIIFCYGKLQ